MALAAGILFYALSDVLLWQRIFEQHDLFEYDRQYQDGHLATLVGLIAVGVVLLWDAGIFALWYAGGFYTLTFGGVCDVLYYWLDRKPVPSSLPWLDSNPFILFKPAGGWGVVASGAIWIAVWLAVLWAGPVAQRLLRAASHHDHDVVGQRSGDESGQREASSPVPLQEPQ